MLLRAVLVSEAVVPPPLVMSVPDLRATLTSRLDHGPIRLHHPSQRAVLAAVVTMAALAEMSAAGTAGS